MSWPHDLPEKITLLAQKLDIQHKDIEEHHTTGHGHGGQKKNRTKSCVELTHVPTRETIRVQESRHQHTNRITAYSRLIKRLAEKEEQRKLNLAHRAFVQRKHHQRRPRKLKERILQHKKHRGELKASRQRVRGY